MISKGTPAVDHVEVWFDGKTREFSELVYVVQGVGRYFRRDKSWVPAFEDTQGQYDDTRVISLEKRDALKLDLKKMHDSGKKINIEDVAEYESGR